MRRLLRQHFAAAHDRLQLRERGRGDEERRLIAPGARQAHRLLLVRRVLHVGPGVEPFVGDVAERLQHALVQDRHRQLAPRPRRAGRPRQRVEGVGPERQGDRAIGGDDAERAVGRSERQRIGERRHLEPAPRARAQSCEREPVHPVDEPMVGKDRQPRRVEAEERHQLVVGAGMPARVLHRRLVAMVAVGDDHAGGGERRLDARDRRRVGHAPEAMALAPEVARLRDGLAAGPRRLQQGAAGVGDHHEEQSRVRPRRLEQPHAVLLRPRVSALVGQHLAARVVGHLSERDEADARDLPAAHTIGLMVGIDRGRLLLPPHPLGQPRVQRGARPRVLVAVVPGVRDANDVGGTHRVQRVLLLGADLIVRRRDDLADLSLPADRVAITAERPNAH